jgi:hypothetical protein
MAASKVGTPEEYQTVTAETTATITISQTPTEDNLLVALGAIDKSSGGITYPSGWTVVHDYDSSNVSGFIAYKVAGASEGTTYAFTAGTASRVWAIWSAEYSGLTTPPLDKSSEGDSGASAVTAQATGSTGVLAQADELALAILAIDSGTAWKPYTVPSGFTEEWEEPNSPIGGDPGCRIISKVTTVTDALNPNYTTTDTGDQCWAAIATFKIAGATAGMVFRRPALRNPLIRM